MKSQIMKLSIVVICFILATRPICAWQFDAGGYDLGPVDGYAPNGSGFGPGVAIDPIGGGPGQSGDHRQVRSIGLMITWSENNDEVRGFSNSIGEWETLKIERQNRIIPVVANSVAAVRVGDSMAAFSGVKGWWDVIPLSKGSAEFPVVSDDLVQVQDDNHLYTFSAAKGQWTSPTDPELQSATVQLEVAGMSTKYVQKFDQWLHEQPVHKGRGIRLMVTGSRATLQANRQSWLKEAEAKLREYAAIPDAVGSEKSNADLSLAPVDAATVEAQIASLRQELQSLDSQVNVNSKTPDKSETAESERRKALRKIVEKSFDLRQQMQRMEAQRIRLKLQLIETNLDARERSRELIIGKRIEALSAQAESRNATGTDDLKSNVELLAFSASYCQPCQQMVPVWDRLRGDGFPIRIIDITENPALTRQYKIDRIPMHVLIANGQEVRRFVGQTSEAELRLQMNGAAKDAAEGKGTDPFASDLNRAYEDTPNQLPPVPEPRQTDQPNTAKNDGVFRKESTHPATEASRGDRLQFKQPDEILRELRAIRDEINRFTKDRNSLEKWRRPFAEIKSSENFSTTNNDGIQNIIDANKLTLAATEAAIARFKREWTQAWASYQAQLRLLQLDVEEARLNLDSLTQQHDRLQKLAEHAAISSSEVQQAASAVAVAKIKLQRAEEVLKLYADIEKQDQELNPDSVQSEEPPLEKAK